MKKRAKFLAGCENANLSDGAAPAYQDYHDWSLKRSTLSEGKRESLRQELEALPWRPLISVIMPVWRVEKRFLEAAINSVLNQVYSQWELCITDDASGSSEIESLLYEYAHSDKRVKVHFSTKHQGIAAATNEAVHRSEGAFAAFFDHDDLLTEDALARMVKELNLHPGTLLLYSDHDKVSEEGCFREPLFKPDWDLELLFRSNYISHLLVVQRQLLNEVGMLRPGTDGAQDWDLLLRISESISRDKIRHIPEILYHWRAVRASTAHSFNAKPYVPQVQKEIVRDYFRRNEPADPQITSKPDERSLLLRFPIRESTPLATLILEVPHGTNLAFNHVKDVLSRTKYQRLEVLLLYDGDAAELRESLKAIPCSAELQILPRDHSNRSAGRNISAGRARGEILAFLSEQIEIFDSEWLDCLIGEALRPAIAAVGVHPYLSNGFIEWHPAVTEIEEAIQEHREELANAGLPPGLLSFSILSPNCLVARKDIFDSLGGFQEDHSPLLFLERDYCMRAHKKSWRISASGFDALFSASCLKEYRKGEDLWDKAVAELVLIKNERRPVTGDALSFLPPGTL